MVKAPPPMDFKNRKLLLEEYYPKMAHLAKQHTGATEAYVWTHLLRDETSKTGNSYSRFAHSDAGAESPAMFRLLLQGKFGLKKEDAENCEIMMVNIWHPRDHPAYRDPLCLLDATSLQPGEEPVNIRYVLSGGAKAFLGGKGDPETVEKDRRFLEGFWGRPTLARFPGELPAAAPSNGAGLVGPTYSPAHRWVFCSDQRPDEAWIFKQYDTRNDVGRAKTTFHNSFHDPFYDKAPSIPGRRSAEFRLLLTFPKTSSPSKL